MSPARTFFYGMAMGSAMSLGSCSSFGQEVTTSSVKAEKRSDPAVDRISVRNAQTSLIQNTFVASPIAGTVVSIEVQEGQRINDGTVLVRLKQDLAEKELSAARASLEAARLESDNDVNLRFAKRSLQVRQQELLQSQLANETYAGAVSEMELREIRLT
ncbi:MAG: biotin/lipoyl-binding protein, partial [Planctomycetota bacterium]